MEELTIKQSRFVLEYLVDCNATKAAIRAGYAAKNADKIGHELLGKTRVRQLLDEQIKAQQKRTLVEADRVLKELYAIAMVDIRDAFREDGTLKALSEMPARVARAIASIETVEVPGGVAITKKIKFWPKVAALELLGKHLKLFTDKIEVSTTDALADRMKAARERRVTANARSNEAASEQIS
ncbi:MAG: hypothetical protein A2X94_00825 [Bdellovibrionales bacterium GWB1_55_8]|nr:MAG: hypothetical protein A2X94_00825 [Bdellovibrionales bacterium GWB1_55_8]